MPPRIGVAPVSIRRVTPAVSNRASSPESWDEQPENDRALEMVSGQKIHAGTPAVNVGIAPSSSSLGVTVGAASSALAPTQSTGTAVAGARLPRIKASSAVSQSLLVAAGTQIPPSSDAAQQAPVVPTGARSAVMGPGGRSLAGTALSVAAGGAGAGGRVGVFAPRLGGHHAGGGRPGFPDTASDLDTDASSIVSHAGMGGAGGMGGGLHGAADAAARVRSAANTGLLAAYALPSPSAAAAASSSGAGAMGMGLGLGLGILEPPPGSALVPYGQFAAPPPLGAPTASLRRTLRDFCWDDRASGGAKAANGGKVGGKAGGPASGVGAPPQTSALGAPVAQPMASGGGRGKPQLVLVDGKMVVTRDSITLPAGGAEAVASYAYEYGLQDAEGGDGGGVVEEGPGGLLRSGRAGSSSVGNMHPPSARKARVAGTYGAGAKRGRAERWSADDTARFYEALRACGTDFTLVASFFPRRDRKSIVAKFRREEHERPRLVDAALKLSVPFNVDAMKEMVGARKAEEVGVKAAAYAAAGLDQGEDEEEEEGEGAAEAAAAGEGDDEGFAGLQPDGDNGAGGGEAAGNDDDAADFAGLNDGGANGDQGVPNGDGEAAAAGARGGDDDAPKGGDDNEDDEEDEDSGFARKKKGGKAGKGKAKKGEAAESRGQGKGKGAPRKESVGSAAPVEEAAPAPAPAPAPAVTISRPPMIKIAARPPAIKTASASASAAPAVKTASASASAGASSSAPAASSSSSSGRRGAPVAQAGKDDDGGDEMAGQAEPVEDDAGVAASSSSSSGSGKRKRQPSAKAAAVEREGPGETGGDNAGDMSPPPPKSRRRAGAESSSSAASSASASTAAAAPAPSASDRGKGSAAVPANPQQEHPEEESGRGKRRRAGSSSSSSSAK